MRFKTSTSTTIGTSESLVPIDGMPCNQFNANHRLASSTDCLSLRDVMVVLVLALIILTTLLGNVLVILAVLVYRRLQTFTNLLLVSLAIADFLVGALIMPAAVVTYVHGRLWTMGPMWCKVFVSLDVFLCTASILNLCVISLDRYGKYCSS